MVKLANRKFLGRQAGIEVSKEFLEKLNSMRLATPKGHVEFGEFRVLSRPNDTPSSPFWPG